MDERHSVELQQEIRTPRDRVWPLLTTAEGLSRWTDAAEFVPRVGAAVRLRLGEATGVGTVLAIDEPQHVSFSFDWEAEPLGVHTVVAFDAIDHGEATHLTLRHVGLPTVAQRDLHGEVWRHWFGRLVAAAAEAGHEAAEPVG